MIQFLRGFEHNGKTRGNRSASMPRGRLIRMSFVCFSKTLNKKSMPPAFLVRSLLLPLRGPVLNVVSKHLFQRVNPLGTKLMIYSLKNHAAS